jgi:hypothetical protein
MGRGQTPTRQSNDPDEGWTKQELIEAAGATAAESNDPPLSPKTFDLIRKAARVRGPTHGGMTWVFSPEDLVALVQRAEGGAFTERGLPAARAWRALLAERGIHLQETPRRSAPRPPYS